MDQISRKTTNQAEKATCLEEPNDAACGFTKKPYRQKEQTGEVKEAEQTGLGGVERL